MAAESHPHFSPTCAACRQERRNRTMKYMADRIMQCISFRARFALFSGRERSAYVEQKLMQVMMCLCDTHALLLRTQTDQVNALNVPH